MGMTMTQKILARHAGLDAVTPGQLINACVDIVMGNDITSAVAIDEYRRAELGDVFDRDKIVMVMDHFTPNKDIKAAEQCKKCRNFAKEHSITNFFDVGEMGIEHALLPEKGFAAPGKIIVGADSHTCTYGALGAFSTGIGSTDMAAAMYCGKCWFRVPEAIKINLTGKLGRFVSGKDVILHLIGLIGVDGALYKSLEFSGEGVAGLSIDDRLTISNMAIEAGAKNGIFPADEVTLEYLKGRVKYAFTPVTPDKDAEYSQIINIDLSQIPCTVAYPHLPENTHPASQGGDIRIDQVVIGSCTNGRISDMAAAAEILKGKHTAEGVRTIVIPATQAVFKECIARGYADIFIDAGCVFSTPTCGPCLGGHMGVLAAGERAVSTTNRNFVGRMGHTESQVYLASPAVAAASALTGYITDPKEVM